MASLSLYSQFETNLMSNRKVIELLLQLKTAKTHGKNYIKVRLPWSAIFRVIVYSISNLFLKFKKVSDANLHFCELKQCQINNLTRKSDRVNKPLYHCYDVAVIP